MDDPWKLERALSTREHLEYLLHEASAVAAQLERRSESTDTLAFFGATEDIRRDYDGSRCAFVSALHKVVASMLVGIDRDPSTNLIELIRRKLPELQRFNNFFVASSIQRRRSWAVDYSAIQRRPRLNLGEVHCHSPYAIGALENICAECEVKLAIIYDEVRPPAPLIAVVSSHEYSLAIPTDFAGYLRTPLQILDTGGEGDPAPAREALANYLSLCYVTHPRWAPATLRYASLSAHEHLHRLLLLIEPTIGVTGEVRRARVGTAARMYPAPLLALMNLDHHRGVALLTACYLGFDEERIKTANQATIRGMVSQYVELLSDLGGLCLMGPSYVWALLYELSRGERYDFLPYLAYHPNTAIRLTLLQRYVRMAGYWLLATAVDARLDVLREESRDILNRYARHASDERDSLASTAAWQAYTSRFSEAVSDGNRTGTRVFDSVVTLISSSLESAGFPVYVTGSATPLLGPESQNRWSRLADEIEGARLVHASDSAGEVLNALWVSEGRRTSGSRRDEEWVGRTRLAYRLALYNAEPSR